MDSATWVGECVNPLPMMLVRDWRRELNSRVLRRQFDRWRDVEPILSRFADPSAVVRFLREPGPSTDKDEVLRALLVWARYEVLGARLVLEAMRPGFLRLAKRVVVDERERDEMWSLLLAAAWEKIRSYPVEHRPRRVAANLLLDTLHQTLSELRRARAAESDLGIDPTDALTPLSWQSHEADVDALLDRAVRAFAIARDEAEMILATRIDGVALAALAQSAGVPYNTMKLRRQRAERRLLLFLGHQFVPRGPQNRPSSLLGSPALGQRTQSCGDDQSS